MTRRARRNDRGGGSAIELILVITAVLAILGLLVASGRYALAKTAISGAAGEAARAAAISRTAGEAQQTGRQAAITNLTSRGVECVTTSVDIDTRAFNKPAGTPGTVTAHVSCSIRYSDLILPGAPGGTTLKGSAVEPLDTYRSRR